MSDRTALTLTLHATHDTDRDGIRAALSAQGLEAALEEFLDTPAPGTTCTAPEVDISGGAEHRTLAEALVANTRHTAFELVHYPDVANCGYYAAYVPGCDLYITFADADGDPYALTDHIARRLAEAPATMTVHEWLGIHGPARLGNHVRASLGRLGRAPLR
ncbi:hypothetical protein [Streptomyces decoyicus]|uniref:hypothetical protein n=1 Tax=Streptomyces decoyicus TaxID=249567 RepID=UPI003664B163